jgi:hypothetical protein
VLQHIFTNPQADGTNTQIVRPSDWNSAHLQNLTLSGNTAGVSTLSGTNIVIQGGPNATVSGIQGANEATVQFSGGAGAAGNTGYISAGAATASLGTVVFSNSNGVSFGVAGQTVTAQHNGLTSQSNQAVSGANGSSTFQTLSFADSNGVSWSTNANGLVATVKTDYLTSQSNQAFSAQGGSSAFQTLSFSNANGATFSNSNGQVQLSYTVPSIAGLLSAVNLSAGTTSSNLSAFVFSNSNGLAFGLNGATVTGSYTVPTQSVQTVGLYATSNTTQSSSGTVDARSLTFAGAGVASVGVTNGSVVVSVPAGGGGDGINALVVNGGASTASTTLSLSNSNNVTFGINAGVITASASFNQTNQSAIRAFGVSNTGQTAGNTGVSTGVDWVLAGSQSITLSQSTAAGGPNTVWFQHPAWLTTAMLSNAVTLSNIRVSAGTTSNLLSALTFADGNGVSFGINASTVTASHNGLTSQSNQNVTAANGGFAFQTLSFSNANGMSFGTSAGSAITGSYTVPSTAGLISAINLSAGTTSSNLSAFTLSNSNGLAFGLNGGTVTGSYTVPSVTQYFSATNTTFNGANISGSITNNTNGLQLSLSVAAPGAAAENNWFTLAGNVAGNSSASGSTIQLAGSNNITVSGTNNSQIVISGPTLTDYFSKTNTTFNGANISGSLTLNTAGLQVSLSAAAPGGGGFTQSGYIPAEAMGEFIAAGRNATVHVQPMEVNTPFQFDQFRQMFSFTWATNSTGSGTMSWGIGIYTKNASTLSLLHSISSSTAYTLSGTANSSAHSGPRLLNIAWTSTITQGRYWAGLWYRTTSAGANHTIQQMVVSNNGANFSGTLGSGTANSNNIIFGFGEFTTSTNVPVSMAFSGITGTGNAQYRQPIFHFASDTI